MEESPTSQSLIDQLGHWLNELAGSIPAPVKAPVQDGFQWELQSHDAKGLVVAKAVRMVSGLHAAVLLADSGFVTECAAMLRMVSDFAQEIVSTCEGMISGEPTAAQTKFVEQFYRPFPTTVEERVEYARERYVGREEHLKSDLKRANAVGLNGEQLRNLKRALNAGYDAYVHGGYQTAMELYHGGTGEFMVRGHESVDQRQQFHKAISGKLHEVIYAFALAAEAFALADLLATARAAMRALDASGEYE